jgi:hypothetical protein
MWYNLIGYFPWPDDLVHRLLNPLGFAAGSAAAEEKQPTAAAPEGCVENGSAASLLVSHVSI